MSSNIKRILKNLFFLFIGEGASGIILFFAVVYIARTLGPHNFGVINFAEGVLVFFAGITSLGLDYIGIREVAKAREKVGHFADTIVSMRLLLAIMSFIMLIIFVAILDKPIVTKYVTVIYGLSIFCAACFLDWVFQGLERMYFVTIGSITKAVVFLSGVFIFVSGHEDVIAVSIIYLLSRVIPTLVLLFFYTMAFGLPSFKIDNQAYRGFLNDSLPIGFLLLAGWIGHYFDSTLLFLWKGEKEAGVFNAAFKPIALITIGLTFYFNAIFPTISKAAMDNPDTLRRVINTSIGGILTILLPFAIVGNYLSHDIIKTIYGEQFVEGSNVFGMLLWWIILVGVVSAYIRTLIAYNKQHYIIWGALTGAVLNVILNIGLIPIFGGFGAAIAKVAADFVTFLFYFVIMKNIIEIPLFEILLCPLAAAVAMFIYMSRSSIPNIWFNASMGFVVYLSILFLMSRLMPGWMKSMIEARV